MYRFTPDQPDTWQFTASFRAGPQVAVSQEDGAGEAESFDDASGSFEVAPRDPAAPGFARWGRLEFPDLRGGSSFHRHVPVWTRSESMLTNSRRVIRLRVWRPLTRGSDTPTYARIKSEKDAGTRIIARRPMPLTRVARNGILVTFVSGYGHVKERWSTGRSTCLFGKPDFSGDAKPAQVR